MQWKGQLIVVLITSSFFSLQAQRLDNLDKLSPDDSFENIKVSALDHSDDASSFVIWVKEHVREHYHKKHTEVVYVIEGAGVMTLGKESFSIKSGDYIFIPRGTPHSVRVSENQTLKVLSIQTPHFDGTDRHFTNPD